MYSKTRFRELLEGLPRGVFDRLVRQNNADKYTKGFSRWDQLLAMIFAQLSGVSSLRELESAFNQQQTHHYHLGTRAIKRSTLADANAHRSSDLFAAVCSALMQSVHRRLRKELGELLYLLDSSPIDLRGPGFDDWASGYRSNVSQGLKLHLMIAGHQDTPLFAQITRAQDSDIKTGRKIKLQAGAKYVFDMGYYDYNWWRQIEDKGSTFVTRLKKNANVSVLHQRPLCKDATTILEDAEINMNSRYVKNRTEKNAYYNQSLRRITVDRPDKDSPLVLVSNDFDSPAAAIAELYKKRWAIELFFKWIKQNLKIKHFLGRSENAVKTHIYTALISYLLLQIYQQKQRSETSLKLCMSALRFGLFQRPNTEQAVADRVRRRRDYVNKIQPQLVL